MVTGDIDFAAFFRAAAVCFLPRSATAKRFCWYEQMKEQKVGQRTEIVNSWH
jgi:hypothetical protein